MTDIMELIHEKCPDGVEYYRLCDVCHMSSDRIGLTDINKNNYVGVENLLPDKAGKIASDCVPTDGTLIGYIVGDILIGNIRPYLKKIWLSDCTGGTNGDVVVIRINNYKQLAPRFLFYLLSSDAFFLYDVQNSKGAKMPRGDKSMIMKYEIPVPPLKVQEEIVRILNKFTELERELERELKLRRKQYEYCRDFLLSFNKKEKDIVS